MFLNYNSETDPEIIAKIVKNHLASNGYYQNDSSLIDSNGLIDILDILDEKIMAGNRSFRKKRITEYQEWNESMQERIIKNVGFFYYNKQCFFNNNEFILLL